MNKQQFKQARKTLNLSCDKFAQELGLKGKHKGRWIRRIEDLRAEADKFQPSEKIAQNAEILLRVHEMKIKLIEEKNDK